MCLTVSRRYSHQTCFKCEDEAISSKDLSNDVKIILFFFPFNASTRYQACFLWYNMSYSVPALSFLSPMICQTHINITGFHGSTICLTETQTWLVSPVLLAKQISNLIAASFSEKCIKYLVNCGWYRAVWKVF